MGVKSVPLNVSFINISSMETKNIQNPIILTGLKKRLEVSSRTELSVSLINSLRSKATRSIFRRYI